MDLMNSIYEIMVASFATEEDLMEYAAIYGIQGTSLVQQRLREMRLLEEIAGVAAAIQFDDEMDEFGTGVC